MATETRLSVGSLFAGIGGFDLGFERAGFKTVWQVEIDEYCRKVLARHFPDAERFGDIRECGKHNLRAVDVICGGFPCQDVSQANTNGAEGLDGERSGLWSEYRRVLGELRPHFAVVENVSALLYRGVGRVLGDLAELGYDTEWDSLRAHDFGAPHLRERVFIVAHARCLNGKTGMAQERSHRQGCRQETACKWGANRFFAELGAATSSGIHPGFPCEPAVARMANGVPGRMVRSAALGNAVVPQIAQWIAERIKQVISEFPRESCTDEVASGVE